MNVETFLTEALNLVLGPGIVIQEYRFASGGCINQTVSVNANSGHFFVKWNEHESIDFFQKEANGLRVLGLTKTVCVPQVYGASEVDGIPFLVLENIDIVNPTSKHWSKLGEELASLHQNRSSEFGFSEDNFIGRLPQKNAFQKAWIDFFIECRLEPQVILALRNGLVDEVYAKKFRSIYRQIKIFFPDEEPSLLHGDLWSGNVICAQDGRPVVIDPAVYFGNREMEIAFTQMFGGFGKEFYQAYNHHYPLLPGFEQRADIHNLYPYWVHVNLFGQSYLSGIDAVMRKLMI